MEMLATHHMYVKYGDKAIELASKVTSSQRVTNPKPYDLLLHPAETAGRLVAAISEIAPSSAVATLDRVECVTHTHTPHTHHTHTTHHTRRC